jgi:hypothetical protein
VQWNTINGREHFVELGTNNPGIFELSCSYQNTINYPGCDGSAGNITIQVLDQPRISAPEKICINTLLPCTLMSQAPNPVNPIIQLTGHSIYTISKPDGTIHSHQTTSSSNPYNIPASFFDQSGFYRIWVQSLAGEYCDSESITVEVASKPPVPQAIDGETHVCLNYPYEYSIAFQEGTITHWSISGGNINGSGTHIGQNASAIWTLAGAKSLIAYREWEDVPGCYSTSLGVQIFDLSLTGSINSTASQFYEDNSYNFTCDMNNGVLPEVYEWKITPASAGSITSGQNTFDCTITWLHLSANTAATIECMVTKCGIQTMLSFPIVVEQNTAITSVNLSPSSTICSGVEVTFEVLTTGAPYHEFYWNFGDGYSDITTSNITSHTFINQTNASIVVPVTIQVVSSTTMLVTSSTVEYITILPQPNASISPSNPHLYPGNGPNDPCTLFVSTSAPPLNYSFEWYFEPTTVNTPPQLLPTIINTHIEPILPSIPPNSKDGFYYCIVTDASGCSTTTNQTVIAEDNYMGGGPSCVPEAPSGISGFSDMLISCATIQVSCTTLGNPNPGGNIESFSWGVSADPSLFVIGSGGNQNLSPPITFSKAGTYKVGISVSYTNSVPGQPACHRSGSTFVNIPWVAGFLHSITCNGTNQYYLNLFDYSSVHPSFSPTNYTWIVFDGTNTTFYAGQLFQPVTVNAGGTYTVSLVIGDGTLPDCTTTAQIIIPNLPVVDFFASTTYPGNQPFPLPPYKSCEGREIYFTNNSTNMSDIISHHWEFGNTDISHMLHPMMTYPSGGAPNLYYVELTVTDKYGCVVSDDKDMEVFDNTLAVSGTDQYIQNPMIPQPFSVCPGIPISPPIKPQFTPPPSLSTSYTFPVVPRKHPHTQLHHCLF